MENKVLYKIKSLNKMIIKNLIKDFKIETQDCIVEPTPTQMQIVEYILKHKNEEIYQKDLENVLNLTRATVSGVLQTMEKNSLIVRVTDSVDTRTKKIILNEEAREAFESQNKKMEELEKIITQDISEEELDTFSKVIEKMKQNMKNITTNK